MLADMQARIRKPHIERVWEIGDLGELYSDWRMRADELSRHINGCLRPFRQLVTNDRFARSESVLLRLLCFSHGKFEEALSNHK